MKIHCAQVVSYPGKIDKNITTMKKVINQYSDVDMIVFPELMINGYLSMDLFLDDRFIQKGEKAVEELINYTKQRFPNLYVVFGVAFKDKEKNLLYNSLYLIQNGEIKKKVFKTLLPDYDIFFEKRYFSSPEGIHFLPYRIENHLIGFKHHDYKFCRLYY
jgi:NAD+ synthase (glutamine-hydrolysing)